MNIGLRQVMWCIGLMVGGALGVALAPSWEFAPVVMGLIAGVTGAVSAQLAVSATQGLQLGVVAVVVGSLTVMEAARQNPVWVIHRCTVAVLFAGLVCVAIWLLIRRGTAPR